MPKLINGTLLNLGKWAIAIIFSAGAIYAVVHFRLNAVEGNITEVKEDVKLCDDMATENKIELIGIKKDIEYLGEKVDRNFTVQHQILTEIKELRK